MFLIYLIVMLKTITIKLLEKNTNMIIQSIEELAKQNSEGHKEIHAVIKNGKNGGKP